MEPFAMLTSGSAYRNASSLHQSMVSLTDKEAVVPTFGHFENGSIISAEKSEKNLISIVESECAENRESIERERN